MIGVLLLTASIVAHGPASAGPCDLLTPDDIRAVQQTSVKERKPSEHRQNALRFGQCVFATDDFVRSVSVSLITGTSADRARGYWQDTFHPPVARTGKKTPPRPVANVGDEAFWTGEARAGALYVLSGDAVLRISIGGVADEEERMRRTERLAQAALRRLRQTR